MLDLSGGAQGEGGLPVWWVCGPQIAGMKHQKRCKGILSLIYWKPCCEKDFMCRAFSSEADIPAWTHTKACKAILTLTVCVTWTFIDHYPQKWYNGMVQTGAYESKNRHERSIQVICLEGQKTHSHAHCSAACCRGRTTAALGQVENSGHVSLSSPPCATSSFLPLVVLPSLFPASLFLVFLGFFLNIQVRDAYSSSICQCLGWQVY